MCFPAWLFRHTVFDGNYHKSCAGPVLTNIFEQVAITGSTNADLLKRADEGAEEGLWLRADTQDGGRGRMGREWVSPPGNLYASTIVRLQPHDPEPATLAFVSAVAVHRTLSQLTPFDSFQIKWPNDILSKDGEKLSGMLLERSNDAVVIGIGVNLMHHPDGLDRPVTNVCVMGLIAPLPQDFLELLAKEFAEAIHIWRTHGHAAILLDWQRRSHPVGTAIASQLPDGERVEGHYNGLSDDGALNLRLANGAIRAIHAGDVFLV
jgi:BirA family transcriptional regulator, biotin operon repressor / biotin---[acetyl-CoA-carboxylase] ligase